MGAFDLEDEIRTRTLAGDTLALEIAVKMVELIQAETIVVEAANKATATVGALVNYSRVDDFDHNQIVYPVTEIETLIALYYSQTKNSVTIERRFLSNDPVRGYRDTLNQVWVNLMNNALQAMEYKGDAHDRD